MKTRPILFSGPMVRSLLAGRKTQTRRIVKPQPIPDRYFPEGRLEWNPGKLHYTECNVNWRPLSQAFDDYIQNGHCPYGKPGDRLWVREAFLCHGTTEGPRIDYKAGGSKFFKDAPDCELWIADDNSYRPSIHMPRWASRLTLEIQSVRGERLQEITEQDAKSEGVLLSDWELPDGECPQTYREAFSKVWEHINGPGSLDLNQWVWVIEFKEVEP